MERGIDIADKDFILQLQEKWEYLSDKQKDLISRLIDVLLDDEKAEKIVKQERLIDELDRLIELAKGGRFNDEYSAIEALELVKWWVLDE